MSWNIVGTRNSASMRSVPIRRSASPASKPGMQTKVPLSAAAISSARTPMVWKSGITPSCTSP